MPSNISDEEFLKLLENLSPPPFTPSTIQSVFPEYIDETIVRNNKKVLRRNSRRNRRQLHVQSNRRVIEKNRIPTNRNQHRRGRQHPQQTVQLPVNRRCNEFEHFSEILEFEIRYFLQKINYPESISVCFLHKYYSVFENYKILFLFCRNIAKAVLISCYLNKSYKNCYT
ncbi:unnamed protein product [Phyllotreta striolata]|uniref:Uncharacterized protein n=1 Tax=Phyllotreta striolata TaxID=444603 RepID=A0A9P0GRF5_PHYSR|nr:unnamed protein product [Phyllotreta striolata]